MYVGIYKISPAHDIAEILRMLALITNQSINVDRKSTVRYEDFFYIKFDVFFVHVVVISLPTFSFQ